MKIASINVNGLRHRKSELIKLINDNFIDILCIQEIHKIEQPDVHDIEKATSGVLYLDTDVGWLGTGILLRRNAQNLQIKHKDTISLILKHRLTHIQLVSKDTINFLCVYAPSDHYGKKEYYKTLTIYIEQYNHQKLILVGDLNYVEHKEDRFPKLNKNDKKLQKIFKPQTLGLIDPVYKVNSKMIFTHKDSRIDRFYVSDLIAGLVTKYRTLSAVADHKMILMEIDMDDFKLWGNFYWKINNFYLNDPYYRKDINNLLLQFEERKKFTHILDNWELFKTEIQKTSKSFSRFKARERDHIQKVCSELKERGCSFLVLENILEEEKKIKNFKNKGNLVRAKNDGLNKLYNEGKEINRKEEIKKGNAKFIYQIRENDSTITNKDDIIKAVHRYYQNLFESQIIDNNKIDDYLNDFTPPLITPDDKTDLDGVITQCEITEAIKDLQTDKSPGDDGLTTEFYKAFNSQLSPILVEVYNNIWMAGNLVPTMKNGIIQLIFKKKGTPTELKFWRPISLLNVDYKILTKILAKRLKYSINYLINPYQTSGVKDRDILDNILNLKNIIEYIKDKDLSAALISLDNEKAFDRIEINYLLKVLQKYNFPDGFIKWIKIIYTDITSQVMVNGKLVSTAL